MTVAVDSPAAAWAAGRALRTVAATVPPMARASVARQRCRIPPEPAERDRRWESMSAAIVDLLQDWACPGWFDRWAAPRYLQMGDPALSLPAAGVPDG